MFLLLLLGVLLFGKRLPEIGGSVAKTIVEFKNSLKGLGDDFTGSFSSLTKVADRFTRAEPPAYQPPSPPRRLAPTAPKFVEPEDEPVVDAKAP